MATVSVSTDRPQRDPSYRRKGKYGVVTLSDGFGGRRDVLLGRYNTEASRQAYHRVLAEWRAANCSLPKQDDEALTVNGLAAQFLKWARGHYRRPGNDRRSA